MTNKSAEYMEGYTAFEKDLVPSDCPYLNEYGDNPNEIFDWIQGWSDAYCKNAP